MLAYHICLQNKQIYRPYVNNRVVLVKVSLSNVSNSMQGYHPLLYSTSIKGRSLQWDWQCLSILSKHKPVKIGQVKNICCSGKLNSWQVPWLGNIIQKLMLSPVKGHNSTINLQSKYCLWLLKARSLFKLRLATNSLEWTIQR